MCRWLTFYLLLGGLAGLIGCAVGPNYQTPRSTMPVGFDSGAGSAASQPSTQPSWQQWWALLQDAELNSLIDRATRANLDLGIAMARVGEARSFRYVVAADLWPGIGFSAAGARTSGNDATKGRMAPPLNDAVNTGHTKEVTNAAGFDMSWEVDLFGHVARAVEAAEADAMAVEEARNQVLVTVVADVVRAYCHLRGTQRRLEIARQNVDVQQRTADLVRRRLALQLANELDMALAERQLEAAKAVLAPLAADIAGSQRQLAILLGGDPQVLYAELNRTVPLPQPPTAVALDAPSQLLRHRPDIRQAERQLAAETARIGVAVANFFPQITLSGAMGYQGDGLRFDSAVNNSFIYSLGPGVRWPILDFGRVDAAKQVQDWRTLRALLTYRKIVEVAIQEVDDSLGQFAAEQDRFQHLQAAVAASDKAEKLATARYDRGLTDFLNVLDAQRQLYVLEDQAATSQESLVVNWVALNKALGRGWEGIAAGKETKFKPPGICPPLELLAPDAHVLPVSK